MKQTEMNILATYRELDIAGYDMLEQLSYRSFATIYIAVPDEDSLKNVKGSCIPLLIHPIQSKITWKSIRDLRKIIKKYNIDVIYSAGSSGLSNSLIASVGTKAKNIGYRGTQAKINRTDITYYMGILNPRVKHLVCITQDIKDYLSGFINSEKITVNPKPFDIAWIQEAIDSPKKIEEIPDNAFTVIYVAQTQNRPFKGLTSLIEAFHLIEEENAYLIFIGNYDDKDYQLAKSGKNADRILFLGQRDSAVQYLPNQSVFVLPSTRDAFPRSVREAMACGVPCIVTDIPGARDMIINGESGLLVEPAKCEKLAEAIRYMMHNEDKRKDMGEAARKRIIRDFSTKKYIDTFQEIFLKVYSSK